MLLAWIFQLDNNPKFNQNCQKGQNNLTKMVKSEPTCLTFWLSIRFLNSPLATTFGTNLWPSTRGKKYRYAKGGGEGGYEMVCNAIIFNTSNELKSG